MYRIIPLRVLRRTLGVHFDEIVPSDIPKIHGIDRVIHGPNSISPGPINHIKRPWYMHKYQDDNLLVLQGTRYVDIYCPVEKVKSSFIITPDKVYKNEKLYCDHPAMIVWPAGIFHRIISGTDGSISINFATRHKNFNLKDNFNIYDLDLKTGKYTLIKEGYKDQPDLNYKYPNLEIKKLLTEF
jgi:hypothetical protein